tara:strand:- start:4658 stop:5314 length:657 start_codon:yes stop_codon:yes gene_type:complete
LDLNFGIFHVFHISPGNTGQVVRQHSDQSLFTQNQLDAIRSLGMKLWNSAFLVLSLPTLLYSNETFVKIQGVKGNQIALIKDTTGGGDRGMRSGKGTTPPGQQRGRRGRRGNSTSMQPRIITVPANVKITSAMRERRTFDFRVGTELAGGLKHRVFQEMKTPLSARIVSQNNRIIEINVIISETDINQSSTTANGKTIIAVRPKRPPKKRPSEAGKSK